MSKLGQHTSGAPRRRAVAVVTYGRRLDRREGRQPGSGPVDRILSGPTLRCQQTVQPLARDRFLKIEPLAALGVDAGPTQVRAVFWDRTLRNAVLCTHGETIGRLLAELVAEGLVVEDPLDWPKGSTWLLQRTDQDQVYARLLAPLALEGLHLAEP